MKVGILGTGNIGRTLARKLSAAGYEIEVANSRGPETIPAEVTEFGARAVTSKEAVADAHVVILSIPLGSIVAIAPLLQGLPADTVIIDTSNYYPQRDGTIDAIEAGQAESEWVSEQLGRPVAKAWNAIGSDALAKKGRSEGAHDRLAIPVAANNERDCNVAMALVHDTGLDAVKAGTLAQSWRQQPGAPCYCTDLTHLEIPAALAAAERARLPKRRDLAFSAIAERMGDVTFNPDMDYNMRLTRALFM
jgi:predicted dinucleotide-binding enzyme